MPSLLELQEGFAAALLDPAANAAHAWIVGAGLAPARRIDIYRNNFRANGREALRQSFPVVERLVGEEFFRHAAWCYQRACPSPGGDLNRLGARFPEFLRGFAPAAALVYLPDVARLEWLMEEAFQAADAAPLDIARLAALGPDEYAALRFGLAPACRLLRSAFPVGRIWQAHQPGHEAEAVSLDEGAAALLLRREAQAVLIEAPGAGEFAMLERLAAGAPFGAALAAALAAEAGFDAAAFLRRRVLDASLIDFHVGDDGLRGRANRDAKMKLA